MKSKKRNILTLTISIILLIVINYSYFDNQLTAILSTSETAVVERIIDGDTIVIAENKTSVRLLGINTPERGENYYKEAKEFLGDLALNKTINLEYGKDKTDLYGRTLAYIYIGNENLNLELIEQGFANFYFPSGKDKHYNEFKQAWENCLKKNKNLCEKSSNVCAKCIELKKLDSKNQEVVLHNTCSFSCELTGWKIKDEGRKNFVFEKFVLGKNRDVTIRVGKGTNSEGLLYWNRTSYVWTDTGDTLFLRDDKGKLILWESY